MKIFYNFNYFIKNFLTYDFYKFLIIGLLTFGIYYFFLWVTFGNLKLQYILSVSISYLLAILFHFVTNKIFTFKNNSKFGRQLFKYLFLAIINYFLQVVIIIGLCEFVNLNFYFSAFFASLITMVNGFLTMKLWVFRK